MGHLADSSTPETASPALDHTFAGKVSAPGVEAGAVQAELERVLAAATLRDSEMLKRFLRYVVEQTLAGQADQLKEYRLGIDVFDRAETFDPRLDPVVRMAAGRLRKKLQEYYESDGRQDRIRIEVPKGAYAASFVAATRPACEQAKGKDNRNEKDKAWGIGSLDHTTPELASLHPRGGLRSGPEKRILFLGILLVVALVAGGFYLFSAYRDHQSLRLTDKDTIVLADFANSTGDPVFDDTLKTALAISLEQSPFLNVLSDRKVASTLQTMTRPADTKLTSDLTRELCQRAGSKAYIVGAIGSLGSEYVLGLKAVNCQNDSTLAQEQATAASKEKVLDALGKAASKLRGELGESLATVQRFDTPLVDATTASLDALKAYSQGAQAFREKGPAAALPYAQRAIGLDPNFAIAYDEVGMDYSSLGEVGRASEYFTKAFQLRERAGQRERLTIAALYYRNITGELEKAAATRQELIDNYPREYRGYTSLGTDFASLGKYEKATEVTRDALRLAPDHVVAYDDLANYALAVQHFDEARQIIREAQARKLDNLLLHNALYALAFLDEDSAALAEQEKWFSGRPEENYGFALSSDSAAYAGHVANGRELTNRALASALMADSKETGAIWEENGALREAAYGYSTQARTAAAAGLKLAPSSQGVQVEAALALAMAGDTVLAESLEGRINKAFPLDTQVQSLWLPAIRAQLELDRKNPGQALKSLPASSALDLGLIPFINNISCLYPEYVRGEAFLAAGQGAAAAAEFQKILDHSGMVWNCWTGALAHLGVARANTLQSRSLQGADADAARARALAAYRDFFTLWKDADPGIPVLKQAKLEYAKLH
jgi:Tfp pilus assembly protein PilF